MPVILQTTFRKAADNGDSPQDEAAAVAALERRAHNIAAFPGLIWKIWIAQPEQGVYGGTYLFENQAAALAYLESPIPDDIRHQPEFTTQIFEVEQGFSAITHAPLQRP